MPIPDFIVHLRRMMGHEPLWLPGVTAVVLRGSEVLLVRRSDNGSWSPVTGIVDPGEHPADTAVRETLEETGVYCTVEALVSVGVTEPIVHVNGDQAQYLDHTFGCRYVAGEPYPADDESLETAWFRLDRLPPMKPSLIQRIRSAVDAAVTPRLDGMDIQDERIEVERLIAAEPARIFAVLTDPQGHVDIDSSAMLMSATGDVVRGVGDRFEVHMDREALGDVDLGEYDVTVVIETFEPDREISWSIEGVIKPPIGHVYGYRLVPHEGGTLVTSFYDWSQISDEWRDAGIFPVVRPESLKATLGILARTVTHRGAASS